LISVTIQKRKDQHAALNKFVSDRSGWVTSLEGSSTVTFQAVGPMIAEDLRAAGFTVKPTGTTTRVVANGVIESIQCSSGPIIERRHDGIVQVNCYDVELD
jgi:hypothetical protein